MTEHRPTGAYLPLGQLEGDYCSCGRLWDDCPDAKNCPVCLDLEQGGHLQHHTFYEGAELGDEYHGQFDPDDPNDPVWSYVGEALDVVPDE